MAEPTTDSTEEEVLEDENQEEVEPSQEEDETNDSTDDDTSDEEDEETDDDTEDDDSEEEPEDFKKRFTQFKGDNPEEYLKNLEDGYAESGKEAVKLSRENRELKATVDRATAIIAANPDLANALQADAGQAQAPAAPVNPALSWAETQMQETWAKEYRAFADLHPEIETDAQLADQVDQTLATLRQVIQQTQGRQLGMGEGLDKAWKILGKDTANKQEEVSMAAKAAASQGKSSGAKTKPAKSKFSEAQINTAMEMMNVDRTTAIKQLSQYVK